jgi:hypothetical protein
MLWVADRWLEFLLVEEEPHPLNVVERDTKGLMEGSSFGHCSSHIGAAGNQCMMFRVMAIKSGTT